MSKKTTGPKGIEFAPYKTNPRKISGKQMDELEKHLRQLGDLSGIVHDLNSGQIV